MRPDDPPELWARFRGDAATSKGFLGLTVALAAVIVGCGSTNTETATVTAPVQTQAQNMKDNQITVETDPQITVEATISKEEAAIAQADVEKVYSDYLNAVRAGDAETACGLMTEEYQARFVREANSETSIDLSGPDCESVTKKAGAVLNSFVPRDAKITFVDFKADGPTATITATLGTNDPETLRFQRDGDKLKLSADE